jgi:hypothetical protein
MDHAEARELLELAAAEPGGLDRLAAGDTADAAALATHLAGCEPCSEEFGRLRRAAAILRTELSAIPPPDLRERTLAFVAAVGRDRSGGLATASATDAATPSAVPYELPVEPGGGLRALPAGATGRPLLARPAAWLASIAAAVVVAVALTSLIFLSMTNGQLSQAQAEANGLSRIATATVRVGAMADAQRVGLASSGQGQSGPAGTILFSPSSHELVVIATGLSRPPAGQEYRCWIETGGSRQRVGKMFFSGDFASWAGPVDALATTKPGAIFGVSLVSDSGDSLAGDPVLSGSL